MTKRIAGRVAPKATRDLAELSLAREQLGELAALRTRIEALETAVGELREEVDESRRDGRRVAELYDLVFERLRADQV
jgi:phage shock protein A